MSSITISYGDTEKEVDIDNNLDFKYPIICFKYQKSTPGIDIKINYYADNNVFKTHKCSLIFNKTYHWRSYKYNSLHFRVKLNKPRRLRRYSSYRDTAIRKLRRTVKRLRTREIALKTHLKPDTGASIWTKVSTYFEFAGLCIKTIVVLKLFDYI